MPMADRCLLYYITDRSQLGGNELARRLALLAKVAEAASAGVDYIQLREKDLSARELETLAREAAGLVRENSRTSRLFINSRTDIALAAGADGVHLRAEDVAPHEVRNWTPASNLIAVSCHSVEDVFRAESEGADFVVFAPVFGKINTLDSQPAGLAVLREACRAKIPVLALGGVTLKNAPSCLDAGAAGVAGIRLFQENRIEDVVRVLRTF
jgi:thiamine-phosphate pyrophosphorylase